jgi:hypothetical protein
MSFHVTIFITGPSILIGNDSHGQFIDLREANSDISKPNALDPVARLVNDCAFKSNTDYEP